MTRRRKVAKCKSGVYLLHFHSPLGHASHYLGYADDIDRRIAMHHEGRGARLTQVARERGITFTLARVWEGQDRNFERRLKNRKNAPKLCPYCNGQFTTNDVNFYQE